MAGTLIVGVRNSDTFEPSLNADSSQLYSKHPTLAARTAIGPTELTSSAAACGQSEVIERIVVANSWPAENNLLAARIFAEKVQASRMFGAHMIFGLEFFSSLATLQPQGREQWEAV